MSSIHNLYCHESQLPYSDQPSKSDFLMSGSGLLYPYVSVGTTTRIKEASL